MTEEAATVTLRRAVRRARILMGQDVSEDLPVNQVMDQKSTSPMEQPVENDPIAGPSSQAMVASTSSSSNKAAPKRRSASIPKSTSPTGDDSTTASTSGKPLDQPKKRNPFTPSDVEQIVEYISNLPEFPKERFHDTLCTAFVEMNDTHTKWSYSSFLKDNTFGQGRKLEDLIAKRRSQLRRQKRNDGYESDPEVWKEESKLLQGLFRPSSLGIIKRRKQELEQKEKEEKEMGKGKGKGKGKANGKGKTAGEKRESEPQENGGGNKRKKSNSKSTK